ncbi:MAG: YHS domain-containing protein [Deltaproteobacteria bacterium]|nr:YHS domain-containing protein [Deltaproteobacteria bacterium]
MVIDPVCKMTISEEKAIEKTEYNSKTYYFCGKGCKDRFEKEPEKYLRGEKKDWIKE